MDFSDLLTFPNPIITKTKRGRKSKSGTLNEEDFSDTRASASLEQDISRTSASLEQDISRTSFVDCRQHQNQKYRIRSCIFPENCTIYCKK